MYMWNFMESHNYVARYPREYPVFFGSSPFSVGSNESILAA